MSTSTRYEAFNGAHDFTMGTVNIGPTSAPSPPQHSPTYNIHGTMQQLNGAPNGGPVTMNRGGINNNFGVSPGKAYQTPPASGPNTPASQNPQSAATRDDSDPLPRQPHTDNAFGSPDPESRENGTGKPSRPPLAPYAPYNGLLTPDPSIRPSSSVFEKEDDVPEKEWDGRVLSQKSPHVATSPSGPPPRARHTVFIANDAKTALENSSIPDIRRVFSKAGLKNTEWIAQAGYNEEELHDRGRYEEVIVFTILNSAVSVRSIDRKKLKSLFPKFPVIIRSHSGEDRYLERGGKPPAVNIPGHQHETDLLENLAQRTASVSRNPPKSPNQANIELTAHIGLAGLSDQNESQLTLHAIFAHKEATDDNDDPRRSVEFSKLSFRIENGHIPFFQRFAHVLVTNGEKSITVLKPEGVSPVEGTVKKATASRTTKSTTYGGSTTLSAAPAVTGQISRTNGRDTQTSSEKNLRRAFIKWENLNPGMKVKYQSADEREDLEDRLDLTSNDILPTFSIPISSSSSSSFSPQTELEDDIMRIRLTSLWTYRGRQDNVEEPERLGVLKRLWHRVTAWRSKEESSPRFAPAFTNLVHCVDLELSTEFLGMVRDWKIESPKPVDMKMDI